MTREEKQKAIDADPDKHPITPDDDTSEIMETASINKAEPNSYIGLSDLIPPKRNVNREDIKAVQDKLAVGVKLAKEKEAKEEATRK